MERGIGKASMAMITARVGYFLACVFHCFRDAVVTTAAAANAALIITAVHQACAATTVTGASRVSAS